MTQQNFSVDIKNKVAVITLLRPTKKNALDAEMYVGIAKALNEISARDDVCITVLTGSGDFYCSGNDLSSLSFNSNDDMNTAILESCKRVRNFVEAFITHKKVLVAIVNGPAIGIAVTTLGLCDIVYCTPNAWFQTPFTQLGLCTEGCSSFVFPRLMGYAKANEILLFCKKINAQEAVDRNLVSRVVSKEALEKEIWPMLKNNAEILSQQSLVTSKKLIRRFDEHELHEANRLECTELHRVIGSDEMKETFLRHLSRRNKL